LEQSKSSRKYPKGEKGESGENPNQTTKFIVLEHVACFESKINKYSKRHFEGFFRGVGRLA